MPIEEFEGRREWGSSEGQLVVEAEGLVDGAPVGARGSARAEDGAKDDVSAARAHSRKLDVSFRGARPT
jgi:hypothetical protein